MSSASDSQPGWKKLEQVPVNLKKTAMMPADVRLLSALPSYNAMSSIRSNAVKITPNVVKMPAGGIPNMSEGKPADKTSADRSSTAFRNLLNEASGVGPAAAGALPTLAEASESAGAAGPGASESGGMALPDGSGAPSLDGPSSGVLGQASSFNGATPSSGGQTHLMGVPLRAAPAADAAPDGGAPTSTKLSADDKRPTGDSRSAKDIIDANPTLKNLGNQSHVKDNLKKQVGDFEQDPDAAYRASQVLDHVKGAKSADGGERPDKVKDDGKIEGFTKDGDARHGPEAGLLQDFGKNGYSALKDNQQLDTTKDGHVKKDGTNMDNAAFAGHEVAKGISNVAGGISHALDKLPGPLKSFLGPMHMMASGISGGANVADAALTGGNVKQAGKDMASGMLTTGSNLAQGVGQMAADTAGKVPGIGKVISAAVEVGSANISGGLNFANTALQGGDLKQAGRAWGGDVAGTAVGAGVGMVDPTGIASGAAQKSVTNAISPSPNEAPAVA